MKAQASACDTPKPSEESDTAVFHHRCPGCGMTFGCDWRAVAVLEEQAHRLKIIAGMWRAKLLGSSLGRPRVHNIDVDAARALAETGLSLRAIGRALGGTNGALHPAVVQRALREKSR